jgi:hypothetical protein
MSQDSQDTTPDEDVPDVDVSAAIDDLQSTVLSINEPETKKEAVRALGSLGEQAIPALAAVADEGTISPEIKQLVSIQIQDVAAGEDVPSIDVSAAIEDLQSVVLSVNSPEIKEEAVRALGSLGEQAIPALAHITNEGLGSSDIEQLALKQVQHIRDE